MKGSRLGPQRRLTGVHGGGPTGRSASVSGSFLARWGWGPTQLGLGSAGDEDLLKHDVTRADSGPQRPQMP